jgi:hypothetical protein
MSFFCLPEEPRSLAGQASGKRKGSMLEHKENLSSNGRANFTEGTVFLPIPPIGRMGKKKNISVSSVSLW